MKLDPRAVQVARALPPFGRVAFWLGVTIAAEEAITLLGRLRDEADRRAQAGEKEMAALGH